MPVVCRRYCSVASEADIGRPRGTAYHWEKPVMVTALPTVDDTSVRHSRQRNADVKGVRIAD